MTDFLTRLAERTQGRAAVVQPLIVPWATPAPIEQTGVAPEPLPVSDEEVAPPEIRRLRPSERIPAESAGPLADEVSIGKPVREDSQTSTPESSGDKSFASDLQRRRNEPSPTEKHPPPWPLVSGGWESVSASPSGQMRTDQILPTQRAATLADTSGLPGQGAAGEQAPIDRAESIAELPARIDAESPRDRTSPVSSAAAPGRQTLQTEALAGPAVPLFPPAVEQPQESVVDSRLAIEIVSATPSRESAVTRAASITRMTLPDNASPDEPAAMPSRSPVESPAMPSWSPVDVPLVPAVNRTSLADRDFGAEPEPIVAPQHASSHPLAVPAIEPEPPCLTERNAAAPTVKVTIGRVEVRAAPPTAPTCEPPRLRQPALSLDDYLKRRNGGSR